MTPGTLYIYVKRPLAEDAMEMDERQNQDGQRSHHRTSDDNNHDIIEARVSI